MATEYLGSDGMDWYVAADGENIIDAGLGDDYIDAVSGQNTIVYDLGDGVDTIVFAPPRTYQFSGFLEEVQRALAEDFGTLSGSDPYSNDYFSTIDSSLLDRLPPEIASVLRDLDPTYGGTVSAADAQAAFTALEAWIGTPTTNVIQFGDGITLADLTVQPGDLSSFGIPGTFSVTVNGGDGLVFQLVPPDASALSSTAELPPLDVVFQFADGTTATLADVLAQTDDGIAGFQYGSESDDALVGSLAGDQIYGNGGNDLIDGSGGSDGLYGGAGDDVISGGSGMDIILGDSGNDVIAAGPGGGFVSGGDGSDVYLFNLGDGAMFIDNAPGPVNGDVDAISFGGGISPTSVMAYVDSMGTLTLYVQGTSDQIQMNWYFPNYDANWNPDGTFTTRDDQAVTLVQFVDADGNVRVFDLASLVADNEAALWGSTIDSPVALFGTGAGEVTGTVDPVGGDYAISYATTGDMFDSGTSSQNQAPVVGAAVSDQVWNEDTEIVFSLPAGAFTDPDGDALAYQAFVTTDGGATLSALPTWLTFNSATGTFSGVADDPQVGTITVVVTASDGTGSVSQSFDLTVNNVNDDPTVVQEVGAQIVDEDTAFAMSVNNLFADADAGDFLSYNVSGADWLSYDAQSGQLVGTPGNADVGTYSVTLTAIDLSGATAEQTFEVTVNNVNDAPTLAGQTGEQTAKEDNAFSFTLPAGTFADVDAGDSLVLSATLADGSALPTWLTFDAATGTFSGTPTNGDVGTLSVRVTATDSGNLSAYDDFNIVVLNTNDAPELMQGVADQSATEGETFSMVLPAGEFRDVDVGDSLTYSVVMADGSALPSWLSFDASTGTLSGTPSAAGTLDLQVVATDTSGATAVDAFSLSVAAAPAPTTPNDPLVTGGNGRDVLVADGPGDYTIDGGRGNDVIVGGSGNDTLIGGSGNDTISGGAGNDILDGGTGNDKLAGGSGDDVLLGGKGNDRMSGGTGNDYLSGGSGNDRLQGGSGVDILQGGSGNDRLRDSSGNGLLDGGSGNDKLVGNSANQFFAGGAGNDRIELGGGNDVIAYNRGDGSDTIVSGQGGNSTLSLGAGIRLDDLKFRRSGDNLVLLTGGGDSITFEDWYRGARFQSVSTLQLITDGMSGSSSLLDQTVETYDFRKLVSAFDGAGKGKFGVSNWALTSSLAQFAMGGSDTEALGGDLANTYGTAGSLAGIAVSAAQDILNSSKFGNQSQTLHSKDELGSGTLKLV